jgi:hypothetical protein
MMYLPAIRLLKAIPMQDGERLKALIEKGVPRWYAEQLLAFASGEASTQAQEFAEQTLSGLEGGFKDFQYFGEEGNFSFIASYADPSESHWTPSQPPHIRVPVDHVCPNEIPDHELRIVEMAVDEHAIRVRYRITPMPPRLISWRWRGIDDLGNEYDECGGAYGPSPDGESLEGVLSLRPLPQPGAKTFRFTLIPELPPHPAGHPCVFEVVLTDEGSTPQG